MNKRVAAVICILVALASFLGGAAYKYEDYRPVTGEQFMEDGTLQTKYTAYFKMPVDKKTAFMWLDWAISYHQYQIDNKVFTEMPLESHQRYIDTYNKIKALLQELEEECGENE